ncbi:FAD/NAD(P)-binding domain-containing protein [Glonium stellatum]|uniref:FAD/NAD(P)-binding domain-containing protein n=1 Tax=Glonium stellatum TaxID=574774 RepID=A0A8E2JUR5_9PEZI|nr:FAD/NAD(P)-binding domain-containing protein [Glonium stellatum]
MTPTPGFSSVIIVGGGPAGLLLSILLARHNPALRVTMLDMGHGLDANPRAAHYGPPAVFELRRAGVIEDVRAAGFIPRTMCWRKLDGTYIAGLDGSVLDGSPDRLTVLPLDRLGKVLVDHLARYPNAEAKWGHKAVDMGEEGGKAWVDVVEVQGGETKKRMEADYVVGCDGATSQVRRSLFGSRNFPGFTWDEQLVATNVYYDFYKFGYDDVNFHIDREHWYMAARITKDGLWRVSYGELPGLSREELIARQPWKFETMLPGNPKPHEYKLIGISPYRIHQRLAEKMRVGRFLLAADAAHVCNPFGGMGLTSGICDVGSLYDCLGAIYDGKADDSILDIYSQVRRQKYKEIVDPVSTGNIRRLFDQDPERALENDEFLQQCKRAETDLEYSRECQSAVNELKYDFSQHFKDALAENDDSILKTNNEIRMTAGLVAGGTD